MSVNFNKSLRIMPVSGIFAHRKGVLRHAVSVTFSDFQPRLGVGGGGGGVFSRSSLARAEKYGMNCMKGGGGSGPARLGVSLRG